jgi:NodT family efflux transporter outer membrane factor (OMF) lipoprotein
MEYVRNGFKVGPNYQPAPAPIAQHWIDASDAQVRGTSPDLAQWWRVFRDPTVDRLVDCASRQNLTLRQAGFRVLESRLQLAIARGEFFPQTQTASGGYARVGENSPLLGLGSTFANQWNFGFNLAWEIDFWGRLRRAIVAGQDNLDASVANYDQAVVTMLGDIAQNYVEVRTDQEQIVYLRSSVAVQEGVVDWIQARFDAGFRQTELDLDQAKSNLAQTKAQILPLEIDAREASNRLCTLLGIPATDLQYLLGTGPIPTVPPEVAVGIPADLLRRRPDVRQAERLAAAQAEQIGIAEAQLYPTFTLNGSMDWQATTFKGLFSSHAFGGSVGPQFSWDILNYGRLRNNVLYQDALLKDLLITYQTAVLQASQDVENGIVTFLRSQVQTRLLRESVEQNIKALKIAILQYETGAVNFTTYATIVQTLVTQQNLFAQAQGQIAQGLVQVYRGMGGGWEIRCQGPGGAGALPLVPPNPYETRQELPAAPASPPMRSPETIPTPSPPGSAPILPQR